MNLYWLIDVNVGWESKHNHLIHIFAQKNLFAHDFFRVLTNSKIYFLEKHMQSQKPIEANIKVFIVPLNLIEFGKFVWLAKPRIL